MIASIDHRPMLTAVLALSTIVLVVVVITLSTLLITAAPPAATSSSESGGGNPAWLCRAPATSTETGGTTTDTTRVYHSTLGRATVQTPPWIATRKWWRPTLGDPA